MRGEESGVGENGASFAFGERADPLGFGTRGLAELFVQATEVNGARTTYTRGSAGAEVCCV